MILAYKTKVFELNARHSELQARRSELHARHMDVLHLIQNHYVYKHFELNAKHLC